MRAFLFRKPFSENERDARTSRPGVVPSIKECCYWVWLGFVLWPTLPRQGNWNPSLWDQSSQFNISASLSSSPAPCSQFSIVEISEYHLFLYIYSLSGWLVRDFSFSFPPHLQNEDFVTDWQRINSIMYATWLSSLVLMIVVLFQFTNGYDTPFSSVGTR